MACYVRHVCMVLGMHRTRNYGIKERRHDGTKVLEKVVDSEQIGPLVGGILLFIFRFLDREDTSGIFLKVHSAFKLVEPLPHRLDSWMCCVKRSKMEFPTVRETRQYTGLVMLYIYTHRTLLRHSRTANAMSRMTGFTNDFSKRMALRSCLMIVLDQRLRHLSVSSGPCHVSIRHFVDLSCRWCFALRAQVTFPGHGRLIVD